MGKTLREWERKHQRKPIRIDLPQSEYDVLEYLAKKQGKTVHFVHRRLRLTVSQVAQALLEGNGNMNPIITPHEPEEELVSSVEEVFRDVEESEKRWREWERKHQLKPIRIDLPESEYDILEDLAKKQDKTVPQVIQALLEGVLSALMPHLHKLKYEWKE